MNVKKKKVGFQSEVKQILHLMVHSLYSNKEIFLRELISNASDATDKLRFLALSNPLLYENDSYLCAKISYNLQEKTITVIDNGIGMNEKEVISNLGTIAKSGTKDFLSQLNKSNIKDSKLIGQFGVGFYSVFIVAKKVILSTRLAGKDPKEGILWESNGEENYCISNINKKKHGTKIVIFLKKDSEEFLDEYRLKNLVKKYSDHISLPIKFKGCKNYKEKNNSKNLLNTWQQINKAEAIWIRDKSKISDLEYKEFYKYISHDTNNPLVWIHNKVEGMYEYISLIYIPEKAPFDMWHKEYKHGLKLYVKRVFIMDEAKQFIPNYLRFVKGLVDSNDLPLNISREILQDNSLIKKIKSSLTKKILLMLHKLSKDNVKYIRFWNEFGLLLKEGPAEDSINIKNISKLLRFSSTYSNSSTQDVSLKDYVKRMIDNQEKIYYLTSDSYISAINSPHLEIFKKNNIEVLLLFDRIDEWMMSHLNEFNKKQFHLISKIDSSLDKLFNTEEIILKKEIDDTNIFIDKIKKYLGDRVKDVKITKRLINNATILITDEKDMSTQMSKLFIAAGQSIPDVKYIFEINIEHPLIKRILNIKNINLFEKWIEFFFNQALLVERGSLENLNKFVQDINQLLLDSSSLISR